MVYKIFEIRLLEIKFSRMIFRIYIVGRNKVCCFFSFHFWARWNPVLWYFLQIRRNLLHHNSSLLMKELTYFSIICWISKICDLKVCCAKKHILSQTKFKHWIFRFSKFAQYYSNLKWTISYLAKIFFSIS